MVLKIDSDHSRFRQIIKGKIRENLRKYISKGELIGKKGKDLVSIPIPQIETPRLKFETRQKGGVGQGEGELGQPLGSSDETQGAGPAGNAPGHHLLEVELSLEEMAEILGDELELPKIEPKGKKNINSEKYRYTGVHSVGPESLRYFKRTYKEALKREIASGTYNPKKPVIIPIKEDRRYRVPRVIKAPESNAVIIYMMDVSGSMWDEQKEIVRIESFWIDTWLRSQYNGIDTRYVIHDAEAREVDRETFFHTRESGGTVISSAYQYCKRIIEQDYPPEEWNIYPFHFSDGDNWSRDDTKLCMEIVEKMLPHINMFCYGQVESPYGSGQFIRDLENHFGDNDKVVDSRIQNKDKIYDSIKDFLGKGK